MWNNRSEMAIIESKRRLCGHPNVSNKISLKKTCWRPKKICINYLSLKFWIGIKMIFHSQEDSMESQTTCQVWKTFCRKFNFLSQSFQEKETAALYLEKRNPIDACNECMNDCRGDVSFSAQKMSAFIGRTFMLGIIV